MKRPRRGAGTCARPASRSATKRRRTQDNTDMTKQIQDAYIVAATRTPVGKAPKGVFRNTRPDDRSEEHTSELQSLMRISYAVFCLKKKTKHNTTKNTHPNNNHITNHRTKLIQQMYQIINY